MPTTTRPVLRGRQYAISTRKPQATQVGERILRDGGNAFDAAVAAFATLAVTDPAMTGLGGDAFVLVYNAAEKKVYSINGGGTAPQLATIDWYNQNAGGAIPCNDGLLAASIPGALDACYILLSRWGTRSFDDLLPPAIELADAGFPISEYFAGFISEFSAKIQKYPATARIYMPLGRPLRAGEVLCNPNLARTLRAIAAAEKRGGLQAARNEFYKGDIARDMGAYCEQNGGLYRYEDFANYSAKVEEPISLNYQGFDIFKNPSATQGPTELFLLNTLSRLDLRHLGHNTTNYIHTCIEAAKLAYADRERYLGDMDFVDIPYDRLLSQQYAEERRKLIDPDMASFDLRPGTANLAGAADHHGDTSYLAVVDQQGNAVSFTPSLHSAFGTGVTLGELGFILNCRGDYYELNADHPNSLQPGKRARSTLAPTIVTKSGELAMVLGSPGGDDQPMRIAQTLLNVIDFGMNIQEAIEAPRWSTTSFPASEFPHTMYPGRIAVEDRIPEFTRDELSARGHKVTVEGPWVLGATSAILLENGILNAGADPRGDGYALAW